jgi:hypothetical protein
VIRFDQAAVGIGAIGLARAAQRTPTVNHQSRCASAVYQARGETL